MNKKYFLDLLKYDLWVNKNIANFLKDNLITEGKELELFSHIFNAEIIWLKRVKGESNFPGHMEIHTPEECDILMNAVNNDWINFINSIEEEKLITIIEYKNIKGEQWKSAVWEIITHMINHSSYHRAQIAFLIRQKGMKPPSTDFIGYSRQRQY
jgi:uncharacterized damage-inducible protein DinB